MNTKKWFKKLVGSIIQGGSHAGAAYLGLAIAHAEDASIPAINLKGFSIIIMTSAMLKMFNFLEANPVPPDDDDKPGPFTSTGGLAMIVMAILMFSGCSSPLTPSVTSDNAQVLSDWVKEREGFIENAVSAITQIAVYATEKDTAERAKTIAILHAVSINLNALVDSGSVDPDSIKSALKIDEDYFGPILQAISSVIQSEVNTFKENGYGDLTIEIIKAVSQGIKDGTAQ